MAGGRAQEGVQGSVVGSVPLASAVEDDVDLVGIGRDQTDPVGEPVEDGGDSGDVDLVVVDHGGAEARLRVVHRANLGHVWTTPRLAASRSGCQAPVNVRL